jgi:hypothetical protein
MVVDSGQFVSVARRLGEQVSKCYYWSPADRSLPLIQEAMVGDGFDEIERVESIWDVLHETDFFVFPDIGHGSLQKYLVSIGKPVWGHRGGDVLESNRGLFLKTLESVGLDVPDHDIIKGLTNLRLFLKDKEDKYIKISKWRGNFETFHWVDWGSTESELDNLAVEFGPAKEMITFYVFDPIDTDIEDGCDTYCIDGKYPSLVLKGMEAKDKSYLGTMMKYDEMPEQLIEVNGKFASALRQYDYRGFFSTEVRILPDRFYFIDPTCFSEDTEVLTDSGWKLFPNLKKGDKVATRHESGQIQFHVPSAFHHHKFDGEMVLITNPKKTIECLVTPDHNVLRTGRDGSETCLQRADSLTDKGYIPRTGFWKGERPEFFELPAYRHGWLSGRWGKCFKEKNCPPLMVPMKTMLKFLGYYLSEGSIGGDGWLVSISQFKHKEKMADDLRDFPFQPRMSGCGFQLHSVQLAEYCKQFGRCNEKFVPEWIGRLCPEYINIFLDAYTLGDGSVQSGSRIIYTTSRRIADGLQELFFKSGSVASIYERETAGTVMEINGRKYVRNFNQLQVCETKTFRRFWFETGVRKSRYIRRVPYKGDVYCVTVPNSTLYVRRNGKPFWSGNCRAPSPPHQLQTAMWDNYAEILWQGANGVCIDPEANSKFGAQALLSLSRNEKEWAAVKIPDSIKDSVKCGFCCEIDGRLCFPPSQLENMAGYLTATGDTIEEAIASLQDKVKELPASLKCEDKSLADLLKQAQSAEDKGMTFTKEQEIPEPSIVLGD